MVSLNPKFSYHSSALLDKWVTMSLSYAQHGEMNLFHKVSVMIQWFEICTATWNNGWYSNCLVEKFLYEGIKNGIANFLSSRTWLLSTSHFFQPGSDTLFRPDKALDAHACLANPPPSTSLHFFLGSIADLILLLWMTQQWVTWFSQKEKTLVTDHSGEN